MMSKLRRWAALDKNGFIIIVGITNPLIEKRFNRRCFKFSCGAFGAWVADGARYCELFINDFSEIIGTAGGHSKPGLHISRFPHGRIRQSRDVPFLAENGESRQE
jgi:hypothetical protein